MRTIQVDGVTYVVASDVVNYIRQDARRVRDTYGTQADYLELQSLANSIWWQTKN